MKKIEEPRTRRDLSESQANFGAHMAKWRIGSQKKDGAKDRSIDDPLPCLDGWSIFMRYNPQISINKLQRNSNRFEFRWSANFRSECT